MITEKWNELSRQVGELSGELAHPSPTIVLASKYVSVEKMQIAYDAGCRHFGENKVQELNDKYTKLPDDIKWHFFGSLQTNKVKYLIDKNILIHSLDRLKLAKEINKQAAKQQTVQACLLQVNISREETKSGFLIEEVKENLENMLTLPSISLRGLMTIASPGTDSNKVKQEFNQMKELFDQLKTSYNLPSFDILSMGMSQDWKLAVEAGSTMIRIGTSVFGKRPTG